MFSPTQCHVTASLEPRALAHVVAVDVLCRDDACLLSDLAPELNHGYTGCNVLRTSKRHRARNARYAAIGLDSHAMVLSEPLVQAWGLIIRIVC